MIRITDESQKDMKTACWVALVSVLYLSVSATSSTPVSIPSQLQKIAQLVIPYINKARGYTLLQPNTNRFTVQSSDSNPHTSVKEDEDEKNLLPDKGITDFEDGDLDNLQAPSHRFDDYGHLRFGRSGPAEKTDDYGYMRFGK
ncbi:uncharacterized protein LOC111088983 [Limulus polyphemus]|uniref:Uncharacterized protein LOC111088983 n=1 Tax=Limulus polyphemus TaxID=6850 RepID=A0ABM1TJY6_LIMPO|nr:uncharacterized protein LOC111088983 [Limulus polyphemus]